MEASASRQVKGLISRIKQNPREAALYIDLSDTYVAMLDFGKAKAVLQQALNVQPTNGEAWARLGKLCGNLGQWDQSADAFEHAHELDSSVTDWLIGFGFSSLANQDLTSASRISDSLLSRHSELSASHLLSGHLHKVAGRFTAAVDAYRQALQINSRQTKALYNLVDLHCVDPSDPVAIRLVELRADRTITNHERADVCFALARIYRNGDCTDLAYRMLQEANRAAAAAADEAGFSYDREKAIARTRMLTNAFTHHTFPTKLEPLNLSTRLMFVVGLPRSGTTLAERVLMSHSKVVSGGELPYMQGCLEKFFRSRHAAGNHGPVNVEERDERELLVKLREQYLDRIFERDLDGAYVIDKLPANFAAVGLIRVLFPDAIVIHCRRDPVATCWSLYEAHFGIHEAYNTSFERLIHYFNNYATLMRHWYGVVPGIIDVRYEDMVQMFEVSAQRLIENCGLEWEDSCLEFYKLDRPAFTASMQQVRKPVYGSSLARWKKYEKHALPFANGLAKEVEAYWRPEEPGETGLTSPT